jgi:histidyl-tRNA synthetase
LADLDAQLRAFGLEPWCEYDLGIVRGLAYYTGTVFEVHEVSGMMRAMAGGGRYDQLIELFGGPAMPAVGFGMGDVVLTEVLEDKGLLPDDVSPRPDVFLLPLTDAGAAHMPGLVASLRRQGLHARMSYKTGRNVGKLIKDAVAARARFAVILDDKITSGIVALKDLDGGSQIEIPVADLAAKLRPNLAPPV